MVRRRLSRSSLGVWAALLIGLTLAGCATAPPARQPISPEADAARALLGERWRAFADLRTLAEIRIRRGNKRQRLAGALLLRAPASLSFEALSPFGTPVVVVAGDASRVTLWEVLDERAFILPASPAANRRWLGLALGEDDLVALLSGRVLPLQDPLAAELLPPDLVGHSLRLTGPEGQQRVWFDPSSGQALQAEWMGGSSPLRAVFLKSSSNGGPGGLTLTTLDGQFEVAVSYRNPQLNTGFDPELLRLTVPEHVRIQDFR